MKYDVHVTRIGHSSRTIQVSATNQEEAEKKALEAAGDLEFSEHDAEYAVEGMTPAEEAREGTAAGPTM